MNHSQRLRRYPSFIMGPLPMEWFQNASSISSSALAIGLMMWSESYRNKLWGTWGQNLVSGFVKITNAKCKKRDMSSTTKFETLKKMKEAGLITLKQRKGLSPQARIINYEVLDD